MSKYRIMLSLVVITCAFLLVAAAPKPKFSDIEGHWAQDVVEKMAAKGVINGYEDGTFRPDATISREETVAMVARRFPAFVNKPSLDLKTGYVDIDGRWSSDYLHAVLRAGLLNGYSDFMFRPSAPITRADAALLILKARLYEPPSKEFSAKHIWISSPSNRTVSELASSDEAFALFLSDSIDTAIAMRHNVFTPLALLQEQGIMRGYPDGSMGWTRGLTRAEFCAILDRIQGLVRGDNGLYGIPITKIWLWHPAGEIDPVAAVKNAGDYFKKAFPDPVERARAIYDTMILNYTYDYPGYHKTRPHISATVGIAVRCGVGVCHHFASIYTAVAQAAGLNAVRVSGYVEFPATTVYGEVQEGWTEDHAWASVTIGDRTIDVDPTWGLGSNKVYFDNLDQYEEKWVEERRTANIAIN